MDHVVHHIRCNQDLFDHGGDAHYVEEICCDMSPEKSRYLWLKNYQNLTREQKEKFESLSRLNLKTARAYHIKLNFQEFWKQPADIAGKLKFDLPT